MFTFDVSLSAAPRIIAARPSGVSVFNAFSAIRCSSFHRTVPSNSLFSFKRPNGGFIITASDFSSGTYSAASCDVTANPDSRSAERRPVSISFA
ncbi:MAG: hypothetical protein SPK75_10125 [Victivallales bacterium]|nr:hypothetical protein [Victivallales bacterium]